MWTDFCRKFGLHKSVEKRKTDGIQVNLGVIAGQINDNDYFTQFINNSFNPAAQTSVISV